MAAGHTNAAEPAASITGVEDRALREAIQRAMTESKAPPRSRSEARRRAREAGDDAVEVLRSQGYYAYVVEPDVSESDPPRAILIGREPRLEVFRHISPRDSRRSDDYRGSGALRAGT